MSMSSLNPSDSYSKTKLDCPLDKLLHDCRYYATKSHPGSEKPHLDHRLDNGPLDRPYSDNHNAINHYSDNHYYSNHPRSSNYNVGSLYSDSSYLDNYRPQSSYLDNYRPQSSRSHSGRPHSNDSGSLKYTVNHGSVNSGIYYCDSYLDYFLTNPPLESTKWYAASPPRNDSYRFLLVKSILKPISSPKKNKTHDVKLHKKVRFSENEVYEN